jgi:hypothetical protein
MVPCCRISGGHSPKGGRQQCPAPFPIFANGKIAECQTDDKSIFLLNRTAHSRRRMNTSNLRDCYISATQCRGRLCSHVLFRGAPGVSDTPLRSAMPPIAAVKQTSQEVQVGPMNRHGGAQAKRVLRTAATFIERPSLRKNKRSGLVDRSIAGLSYGTNQKGPDTQRRAAAPSWQAVVLEPAQAGWHRVVQLDRS